MTATELLALSAADDAESMWFPILVPGQVLAAEDGDGVLWYGGKVKNSDVWKRRRVYDAGNHK